jgi:hypothetical protein
MGWECLGRTKYLDSGYPGVVSPTCVGTLRKTCVTMRGLLFSLNIETCVYSRAYVGYGQQLLRVCKDTKQTPRGDGGGMCEREVFVYFCVWPFDSVHLTLLYYYAHACAPLCPLVFLVLSHCVAHVCACVLLCLAVWPSCVPAVHVVLLYQVRLFAHVLGVAYCTD